ncbi:MAG: TMEM175 family protein [Atopobiaceae bacterium]
MPRGRLEAMSDGVIAIIITITVLTISAPEGAELSDLLSLVPAILSYAISFVGVGTYWNNHHHLMNLVQKVDGKLLWANLLFLFVMSFIPVATDWLAKTQFADLPVLCYVVLNLLLSLSYMNLERVVRHDLRCQYSVTGMEELQKRSLVKERTTLILEIVGIFCALFLTKTHLALVALAAAFAFWVVPDLRIVHLLDYLASDADDTDE